ncbi:MAG: DNA polymerase I [Dehalococcoidia bacterium]|nr:MAG: DNA polymerase I [Dehalococcoidia bacterium]
MKRPLLVLFDGNAIIHRAYHAFQTSKSPVILTVSKTGEVVSAVYGFTQMLLKTLNELKPTHYAIAFDKKGPTFRHQLFDQYKAHRPPTPPELISQMDRVKQLVEAFRIPTFELDGYEADDILGTLSYQASQQDIDTVIVTGDTDTMQLVSPHVKVLYPKPGRSFSDTTLYDESAVSNRYGVKPEQVADYKGLVGDPSDNIPGVPGVGQKTAVKLLQQFGTVENIYDHIDEVTPPKLQETMRQNEGAARQSKQLATIVTEVPVKLNLDKCQIGQYDHQAVNELFRELGFVRLRDRLPGIEGEAETPESPPDRVKTAPPQGDYRIINTPSDLDHLINRLAESKSFAFDLETTSLNPMHAQLVGISFSPAPTEAYYIPVGHTSLQAMPQLPLPQVIDRLKPVLEDKGLAKLAHNGKYDMTVLAEHGVTVNNLTFDTMVAAYLVGEKSLGLKTLAFSKLNIDMTPITDLIGTGSKQLPMSQIEIEKVANYACADADMTHRLADLFGKELQQQGLWQLFSNVEMPLVPVLLRMERNGIALDKELLQGMSQQLGEQIATLETQIFGYAGHEFNINSPQQLGKVLFEELEIPTSRKGKSKYSTKASVLEELKEYEIIQSIQEYRQLTKLKSTYIDALPGLINAKTGRVHTSFNQTRTTTGRLSSSEPNLQNIPVRGETGRQIRCAFIAPRGARLFAGDYSQIDLRALAHLSQDPELVRAFQQDEDIHATTAAQLFNVERPQVTADMRRLAKTVNFGVIYGMSEYGLEQATELSREEAAQFIAAYFAKYPKVKEYLEATKKQARENGYVQTILGRRRFIPEINSSNRQLREAAERMAINMPVQGTSADIIKVAMINLEREMDKQRLKSRMLLQVHDELVLEVPDEEMETVQKLVPQVMSSALQLDVPLKVDTKQGQNWGEMK